MKIIGFILLAVVALSACKKSDKENLHERYMDSKLDSEEIQIIENGYAKYLATKRKKQAKKVKIKTLAFSSFIPPVFANGNISDYLVSVSENGDVSIEADIKLLTGKCSDIKLQLKGAALKHLSVDNLVVIKKQTKLTLNYTGFLLKENARLEGRRVISHLMICNKVEYTDTKTLFSYTLNILVEAN
jgi:hypothetical protein